MSDVAGFLNGLTSDLSLDIILTVGVFVFSGYLLWRTRVRAAPALGR